MTINDLIKRVRDKDKVIVLVEDEGWTNIKFVEETDSTIEITKDKGVLFEGK